jgi:peptide/nickel transport system substrate-binding protein
LKSTERSTTLEEYPMKLSTRAFTLAALLSTAAIPSFAETPDDQLVVGFSMSNVLTLDPAAITGREPVQILANVYDGLVSLDAVDRAKVNPDLAESWEIAADGKSITFHLREGATFASGNPVTAEDVVWSLNRLMTLNLAQASFLKTHGFTAENAAASFRAPDEKTVVVTLPKAVDPRIIVQTLGIVGPGSVLDSKLVMENEKDGDLGADWLNTNSAGSGMFGFEGWKANDRVILTRNDEFWGEPPAMKRIIMRHIPESQNQRLMLEKGDIDIGFSLAGPDLKALSEAEGVEVISQPGSGFYYLAVSMKDERFANPKVREALRYLIDYQGINAAIMPYYGQAHQRPISTGFLGVLPDPGYTLDVEKAKALLAEAGYPDGFKVSLRALADAPFMSAATAIQATLAQAGIEAEIISGSGEQIYGAMRERNFELLVGRGGGGQLPHPDSNPAGAGLQPRQQRRGQAHQLPGLADLVLRSGPQCPGRRGAGRDRPGEAGGDVPGHPGADRGGRAVDPALLRGARLGRLPLRPRGLRAQPVVGHRPRRHHQGALTLPGAPSRRARQRYGEMTRCD